MKEQVEPKLDPGFNDYQTERAILLGSVLQKHRTFRERIASPFIPSTRAEFWAYTTEPAQSVRLEVDPHFVNGLYMIAKGIKKQLAEQGQGQVADKIWNQTLAGMKV